ncbi:unnamed protein product [Oikopleura dioica]|uniref:Uncharacterized protein n=1 Tax=Oikopleura dioica TaxID=34765 RepID=E4Z2A1_OIKDI|nr:unnamed protein product [Oikopleura dioica]
MNQPGAKRPRNDNDEGNEEFFLPKDKKLQQKCSVVLQEFEGYDITGFKFNYTADERLKGRAKCISTACKAKHEPFVCEGGGVKASKDKLRVHIRRYHTTKSTPWTKKFARRTPSLSRPKIFRRTFLTERDGIILESLGYSKEEAKKLRSSRYMIDKSTVQFSSTIKNFIKTNIQLLLKEGFVHCQVDHKSMISQCQDFQTHAFCVALTCTLGTRTATFPLIFEATDGTTSLESIPVLQSVLEEYGIDYISKLIPIVGDAMCHKLMRSVSSLENICFCHTISRLARSTVDKNEKNSFFDLEESFYQGLKQFVIEAKKGLSRQSFLALKKPENYPKSLADFFYDKIPGQEEQFAIANIDDPEVIKCAKRKTTFPLPSALKLIRFTAIQRHCHLILSWEPRLLEIDSAQSEYRYLVQNLSFGLPNFAGVKALNEVLDILMKFIKMSENANQKIPEIIPMIEKIAIEISLLNHAAAEREPEHAKYLKKCFCETYDDDYWISIYFPGTSMYIFWPAHPCRLLTLTDHLESHEDPFYNENGCLLTSAFTGFASTKSWKERAKAFIIDIWRQLDEQTEVDLADLPIGPIEDLQVDPSLLNRSLSLGSATSFGIEGKSF